jgi:hypothetical protein
MKKYNIEPNPLYKMGMKRVGCMPCIMAGHSEIKNIIKQFPDVIIKIKELENKLGRTFFPPKYIPDRYCSCSQEVEVSIFDDNGKRVGRKKELRYFPTVDDVVKYVQDDPNQLTMLDQEGEHCMSYYSICE